MQMKKADLHSQIGANKLSSSLLPIGFLADFFKDFILLLIYLQMLFSRLNLSFISAKTLLAICI